MDAERLVISVARRLGSSLRFDWPAALLPLPGMLLLLGAGVVTGDTVAASIAAGAAFSVGFGTTQLVNGSHWRTMVITAVGMTLAAAIGTLLGNDPRVAFCGAVALGGVCGAVGRRTAAGWWICLQILITYLLAAQFGGTHAAAAGRAALVAGGGFAQLAAIAATSWISGARAAPSATLADDDVGRRAILLHGLRGAICIGVAMSIARAMNLQHPYWAPFTAVLLLKPGLRDTATRGLERLAGTVAGLLSASVIAWLVATRPILLLGAAMIAVTSAFGLQRARYAMLSAAITTSILLMIGLANGPVMEAVEDRLVATLIGGATALAGAALAPRRSWRLRGNND